MLSLTQQEPAQNSYAPVVIRPSLRCSGLHVTTGTIILRSERAKPKVLERQDPCLAAGNAEPPPGISARVNH